MSDNPELGVCYYPEHWSENLWITDAKNIQKNGIKWVRIAEFAWSRIEPNPGDFNWNWLDKIVDILGNNNLKIIMCTPTATPPKWLVDQMPDMVALDENGQARKFGSRSHYSFSHKGYQKESQRITQAVAERYGQNKYQITLLYQGKLVASLLHNRQQLLLSCLHNHCYQFELYTSCPNLFFV